MCTSRALNGQTGRLTPFEVVTSGHCHGITCDHQDPPTCVGHKLWLTFAEAAAAEGHPSPSGQRRTRTPSRARLLTWSPDREWANENSQVRDRGASCSGCWSRGCVDPGDRRHAGRAVMALWPLTAPHVRPRRGPRTRGSLRCPGRGARHGRVPRMQLRLQQSDRWKVNPKALVVTYTAFQDVVLIF